MIVFYEVKVEATGSLQVSLSMPAENTLKRSSDRYRVQGQRLVPVSSEVPATLLPVVPGGPYGNGQFPYGIENYARKPSVEGFDTGTPQWAAMRSYSGQGLPTPGTFVFALDDLVPWGIQRSGYIEFVDSPRQIFLSPVVYKFCGEEWWMRAVAGLHGRLVFTMPLEPDGRTFIFCDLRPKK